MDMEMKCPFCGLDDFHLEERFRDDLSVHSYDDLGEEASFFGKNPLEGFTLLVCNGCGHASLFRNDSPFVREKRLLLAKEKASIPLKELHDCLEKKKALMKEREGMDPQSNRYLESGNSLKKIENNIENLRKSIKNIVFDAHLGMDVDEFIAECGSPEEKDEPKGE